VVTLNNITSTTPGKTILFGEHFVVYGYSSLIFAINKKLRIRITFEDSYKNKVRIFSNLGFDAEIDNSKITVSNDLPTNLTIVKNLNKIIWHLMNTNKDNVHNSNHNQNLTIYINSEIPIGGGLGSSSAFCVSLIGAFYYGLNKKIHKKIICEKSIEAERIINQNTSGVDCSICTFGGLGVYNRISGFKKLRIDIHDLPFLIINSGISHDTFEMIAKVKKIKDNDHKLFSILCKEYERIYDYSIHYLKSKNLEKLGVLMNENHSILKKLSISNSVIDRIVNICQAGGTFGTKITGSGGGGCVLSLIDTNEKTLVSRLLKSLDELKLNYFFVSPESDGFKLEKIPNFNTN
jgi:mevalonate kinase